MKILPVFIRRRVIRIRFLNFLKKESHSFVLRGTVAMLFLFSTGILYAQKVSVRYKDVPLKNVLNDVAKQSKLRLAYSGSFTDLSVKVSVQASGKDVKEVLAELSQKTNVNFEVRNGSIYIYIKEPPQKEKKEKKGRKIPLRNYTKGGRKSSVIAGVNILLFILAVVISILKKGNAGIYVGLLMLLIMVSAIVGFVIGINSFKEENKFLKYTYIGTITNAVIWIFILGMYLAYV